MAADPGTYEYLDRPGIVRPRHSRRRSSGRRAAGVPIDVGCSRPAPRLAEAATAPAADSKSGVTEKVGHDLRTQHGSGNPGTAVTLRRGRGKYFLLTWGTL